MNNIISETEKIIDQRERIRKKEKQLEVLKTPIPTPKVVLKRGEGGIEPVMLRVSILTPGADPEEKERKKYEEMKKRQKGKVDKLLNEFPWFTKNQMTRLIVVSYLEAKLT